MRYQQKGNTVPDVLIRGLDEGALARLDNLARAQGLSRNTFLKNVLTSAARHNQPLSAEHALSVLELVSDLGDVDVMARAWR